MGLREFFEKHFKKWAGRLIVLLVLLTFALHFAHPFGLLENIPPATLGIILGFAIIGLVLVLLEAFVENDKKVDELSVEAKKAQGLTTAKLDHLLRQVQSTTGISSYADKALFDIKWRNLVDNFNSITLIGELPVDYVTEIGRIRDQDQRDQRAAKEKKISVYRSLNTASKNEINEMVGIAAAARPGLIKLYHMYGFEWGSWAMGQNPRDDETEVLLNYANADRGALAGLHLTGPAAEAFVRAITPHFNQTRLAGVSYPPIELASREQVEFIVEEKVDYQKRITEMVREGVPIEGTERICRAMIQLVQNTRQYLHVTHLCINEGAIERTRDKIFREWLQANYAATVRGVRIKRILIVDRAHYRHPVLQHIKAEMRCNNIEVLLCPLDGLKEKLMEDFSIYDGQHLVYMDKGRSYWSGTAQPLARCTENIEKIEDYKVTFESLERRAEPEPS
jgi:hypothetical protein